MVIAGVITFGTAFAATDFSPPDGTPVNVNGGDLNINNGRLILLDSTLIADRSDGVQTAFRLLSTGKQASIQFEDIDDNHIYVIRFTQGAKSFELFDATNNRADISVNTSNGNVGIGKQNPLEQLDVNGNIRLNGNIVSPTDICIGNCP